MHQAQTRQPHSGIDLNECEVVVWAQTWDRQNLRALNLAFVMLNARTWLSTDITWMLYGANRSTTLGCPLSRWRVWPAALAQCLLGQQCMPRLTPTQSGARALDVACGRGRNSLYLAKQGFAVEAVDVSPAAIAQGAGTVLCKQAVTIGAAKTYRVARQPGNLLV